MLGTTIVENLDMIAGLYTSSIFFFALSCLLQQKLSDKYAGEIIFRPSSCGPHYITLSRKVYGGLYAHKDILELGKDHKDIKNLFRLGNMLKIREGTFEDLDEVMDRYVGLLVSHLKAMLSYRKFRKGSKEEVDELLRIEKAEFPTRMLYCFSISHENLGK
ncbi:hypothetical protein WN944_015418 [Citrus x changshan-huyou]|uniref:Spt6 SH2 domain-containing protein n=1 Tax=Citrus x changshan-huyou TaxID=2935761 RepID=A0AAP0M7H2_9ROSI